MRPPFAPEPSRVAGQPRLIDVPPSSLARLSRLVGPERSAELDLTARAVQRTLGARRVWNVSSTAHGGGVAEMLRLLVGYARDGGVDARWAVIDGDAVFFEITKRLHNRLHGVAGDDGSLARTEGDHYDAVLAANAAELSGPIRPGDIVLLHDPQTAGLATHLVHHGARVVWRCHIGADRANAHTEEAWSFLLPRLDACHTFVFSHSKFVPASLAAADVWVVEPSIDPFSPKNRLLPRQRVAELLAHVGLLAGEPETVPKAVLGGAGPFSRPDRMVLQVSRWDYLKDMLGVLHGFAEHVAGRSDARLVLVGPVVDGVTDDPEGAQVLTECLGAWEALPHAIRDAIRLVALPMDDVDRNALMVNATQRQASLVVQKSLQEGFGLTVTEAMWKSRPVVASAVGGIVDQVTPESGVLLDDPSDLEAFGRSVMTLLSEPAAMATMGRRGRRHVRQRFIGDRHLVEFGRLLVHVASL